MVCTQEGKFVVDERRDVFENLVAIYEEIARMSVEERKSYAYNCQYNAVSFEGMACIPERISTFSSAEWMPALP